MDYDHADLMQLASRFQDDCLDSQELARLNTLLQHDDARREFLEFAHIHYCLKDGECSDDCRRLAASISAVHQRIIPDTALDRADDARFYANPPGIAARHGLAWLNHPAMLWGSLAASLLMLVTLALVLRTRSIDRRDAAAIAAAEQPPRQKSQTAAAVPTNVNRLRERSVDFVARVITATNGANWNLEGGPNDFLMRLSTGERIKLTSGLLKIEFTGGAVIILSGPAELEIQSSRAARLLAGSLTGRSESGNFTLLTPKAEVIDIGTEFGVAVGQQRDTKVAVFEGEVHVKSSLGEPTRTSLMRLTTGMSVSIDQQGMMESGPTAEMLDFQRELPASSPTNLGVGEVSLVDVVCGSAVGEYRIAGAIDPLTGHWGKRPWKQPKGVPIRSGEGQYVRVDWNPLVDGVFVPPASESRCTVDSQGHSILLKSCSGTSWGPVWARRRISEDLDPFAHRLEQDDEGFWGAGTTTAMLDRLRWARDGLVGLHANIGITIDLDEVRRQRKAKVSSLRGVVTLLERSHVSQPFQPKSLADFRVFLDGQERYQRLGFCREDGDAQFGASIEDSNRFLTLVVSDSGDGNVFDRVILIDPVLELRMH
jgi:hypothetical protein